MKMKPVSDSPYLQVEIAAKPDKWCPVCWSRITRPGFVAIGPAKCLAALVTAHRRAQVQCLTCEIAREFSGYGYPTAAAA